MISERLCLGEDVSIATIGNTLEGLVKVYREEAAKVNIRVDALNKQAHECVGACVLVFA